MTTRPSQFAGAAAKFRQQESEMNSKNKPSWKSSYLDKPSGNPRGSIKPSRPSNVPFNANQYGGSFLDKNNNNSSLNSPTLSRMSYVAPLEQTPDIKISVDPAMQAKFRARQAAKNAPPPKQEEESVPEHIRRFREREERARKALEEKEFRTKQIVEACFYAWKARAQYPRLRRQHEKRLRKLAKERAMKKLRLQSAIKIQKTFRMYVPRKRYIFVIACRRRRERNAKEIKRIEKKIARMPKDTKAELKQMKQEFADQKKELKQRMRNALEKEEKKTDKVKSQGQAMIEYLKIENEKLRQRQKDIKAEHQVLEKQFDELAEKADEISRNFQSLQQFVTKKNEGIQKHEMSSQKCRHRYLPKYRKDLAERNQHCIVEFRVKMLYKAKLHRIVREIQSESTDKDIAKDAKKALKAVEKELEARPEIPIPEDLFEYL